MTEIEKCCPFCGADDNREVLKECLEVVRWAAKHHCITDWPGMISNQSHKARVLIPKLEKIAGVK